MGFDYDTDKSVSAKSVKKGLKVIKTKQTKVKIVKNERDPPLFTSKLVIKFQNILRNTTSYHTTSGKNPIFRHIKSNNSGTAKVKIVKNERDPPPLFTGKLLINFKTF